MASTTALVPPRRLGTLLRAARVGAGRELVDLAVDSGMSVVELDDIEHGRSDLDDAMLTALVDAYGIEEAGLVPERSELVIDLHEGRIAVNQTDIDVVVGSGSDAILARYLALVYRLRDLPIGSALGLRDIDVGVLSAALQISSENIETRLQRLMENESEIVRDQRRIHRQLLLPLVGVVIAATSLGTLLLVAEREPVTAPGSGPHTTLDADSAVGAPRIATPAIAEVPLVETDLGNGGAIQENPGN